MTNRLFLLALCLPLCFTAPAIARDEVAPITGNWNCLGHRTAQGDVPFTLSLTQNKEVVEGTIAASSVDRIQISSGTFRNDTLEIHIDTSEGNYVLRGKYSKGHISGSWSSDTEQGTWEGDREDSKPNGKDTSSL